MPHILDIMAESLGNIGDVAWPKVIRSGVAMRGENRLPSFAGNYILPFGSVRVPMQPPDRTEVDGHRGAGHRGRNWELDLRNNP